MPPPEPVHADDDSIRRPLLAAALLGTAARANDSAAELDAGGLVLRREPGIALASEDLSIS